MPSFLDNATWFLSLVVELPTFPLFVAYLAVVFLAPVYTRLTRPLDVPKTALVVYNSACCLLSAASAALFLRDYAAVAVSGSVSVFDTRASPGGHFQSAFDMYQVSKVVELTDTLVMVARHRGRQLSFLHVYHHASMLLLSNLASARYPWIGVAFYLCLNSLIHVPLYLYYAVSAVRPQASYAWRKRLTQAQIGQFLADFAFSCWGWARHGHCVYGPVYGATLTALFVNFYYRAYCVQRPRRSEKAE